MTETEGSHTKCASLITVLTKLEQAMINEGIFIDTEIRVWEAETVATGSESRNSADVTRCEGRR